MDEMNQANEMKAKLEALENYKVREREVNQCASGASINAFAFRSALSEICHRYAEDIKTEMVGKAQRSAQFHALGNFIRSRENEMSDEAKAALYYLIHNQRRDVGL